MSRARAGRAIQGLPAPAGFQRHRGLWVPQRAVPQRINGRNVRPKTKRILRVAAGVFLLSAGLAAPAGPATIASPSGITAAGGGGSPTPNPGGTFQLDTRAGGAQSVQGAASLAAAETAAGMSHANGPNAVGWSTTFENSSGGRAWILPWAANVDNPMYINKAGLDYGGTLCAQYYTWYGRTTNGGGVGSVADYDQRTGHKFEVFFFRHKTGGGSTNDNRHTWIWDSVLGYRITMDSYIMAACNGLAGSTTTVINTDGNYTLNQFNGIGPSGENGVLEVWDGTGAVEQGTITSSTAGPNSVFTIAAVGVAPNGTSKIRIRDDTSGASPPPAWGVGNYSQDNSIPSGSPNLGGIPPVLDMSTFLNQIVVHSIRVTRESAPGAKDGRYERWCNGIKVMDVQSPYGRFGADPLRWKEWQIGGPTWNGGPARDSTQYVWDVVLCDTFTNV